MAGLQKHLAILKQLAAEPYWIRCGAAPQVTATGFQAVLRHLLGPELEDR
ncbi:MAG: hypothetical protein LBF65_01995 [Holosporales bacterium]|nr:hypothetical protein [Holosporales bacterium]